MGMRSFDPVRVGELECEAWITYYRRQWIRVLRAALALTRESFGLSWPDTLRGAGGSCEPTSSGRLYSDRGIDEGCDPASTLVAEGRAALVRSYQSLLAAVRTDAATSRE